MDGDFAYNGYVISPSAVELASEGGTMAGFYPGANITTDVGDQTISVPYTWDTVRFKTAKEAIEYASKAAMALIDAGRVGRE